MHVWPNGIELLALLLEAAGVLLLFREVWRGHEAEEHASTYAQLERIEQPMRRGDWEEAWAENYIYRQPTAQRIRDASAYAAAWSGGSPQGDRERMAGRARRSIPVFTTEVALLD